MKRFSIFFLFSFVLFLLSLSFAQTAKMRLDGKPQKILSEFSGVRDANGRLCAMFKIISDMDGFSYDSNNGIVRVDDQPGEDHVYVSPDERVLKIFRSGYEPLQIILSEYGIQLHPKEVWQIKIKGSPKTGDLLPVTVFVQPQDANITVDGKKVSAGQAVKLSKSSHRLRISKEGFKTKQENIIVSEQNVVFNYTLSEVDLQAVQIKSSPQGAQILLDGLDKGVTNKGVWQYPGRYQLKLIKPGYVEINKTINVTESGNNIFSYNLTKNSGSLKLSVTPVGVKILVNKEDYSNRSSIELAPGRYKIELSKAGYHPQSETLTIERGKTLSKSYALTAKTGKLQFNIQPLSAKVTLKQNGRAMQSWTGMKYLKNLQVGSYELECAAPGYGTQTKRITISERQTAVVDIKLKKGASIGSASGGADTMTDQDGNVYKTIKIGSQIWMAENLKVTHYRNGDPIPNVTYDSQWGSLTTGAYCNYDNNSSNANTYGRLYNWYAVNDRRKIAPAGWHVPTDEEWKKLEKYLGMSQNKANDTGWRGSDEGGKMKERGTTHWKSPNKGASNSSGFTALPGGYRHSYGAFYGLGDYGYWWSSTESGLRAWYRGLLLNSSDVFRSYFTKQFGYSVRLIRD